MKRSVIALVLVFAGLALNAQAPTPTPEDINLFYKSTTCIVLEDAMFSEFNASIKGIVANTWTITPTKIITSAEFDELMSDPSYSFLIITQTSFDKDKSGSAYNFLNLLQGRKVKQIDGMPEICAVPLSYSLEGEESEEFDYKLGSILMFMQQHVKRLKDNPNDKGLHFLKYYNAFVPEVPDKTILVRAEDMEPGLRTIEAIRKQYPHPIKLVDSEEIKTAISEKRPGVLILHKVGPIGDKSAGFVFKMLIGADDSRMYYYNQHRVDPKNLNGFLIADLKRLARF